MPELTIDGIRVRVPAGTTVLDAARRCGITIPALCDLPGFSPRPSCLVCVVKESGSGRLIPACATAAVEGMTILTTAPEALSARRDVLDLLAAEHRGDCEAPCRRGCPASIDVNAFLTCLRAGNLPAAADILFRHNPFPALLGRICAASCEKVCRRGDADQAVAIKALECFLGDAFLDLVPRLPEETGKLVAVVGAGPAGLAAAYFLRLQGHGVTVFEKESRTGGGLRQAIQTGRVPEAVLEAEISRIEQMGARFEPGVSVGEDVSLRDLTGRFDAVVLACGTIPEAERRFFPVRFGPSGVMANKETGETSLRGVFAAGNMVTAASQAVQAVRRGQEAAEAVHVFLTTGAAARPKKRYDARCGELSENELEGFMRYAGAHQRTVKEPGEIAKADALAEAERCLDCGCAKREACAFREMVSDYCTERRTRLSRRKEVRRITTHPTVVFEPGKCVQCGRCVRIAEAQKEPLGLTFIGRGFDLMVGVPFGEELAKALTRTAEECVAACPTAALSFRNKAGAI